MIEATAVWFVNNKDKTFKDMDIPVSQAQTIMQESQKLLEQGVGVDLRLDKGVIYQDCWADLALDPNNTLYSRN